MSINPYELHFTAQDMRKTLDELLSSPSSEVKATLKHELTGGMARFNDSTWGVLIDSQRWNQRRGDPLTQEQAAYVSQTKVVVDSALDRIDEILNPKSDRSEHKSDTCEQLIRIFESLTTALPISTRVPESETIHSQRLMLLQKADTYLATAYYTFNTIFSPNFNPSIRNLREDVTKYRLFRKAQRESTPGFVIMDSPVMCVVETPHNYFARVIHPLIKNIDEHAYQPENDSNNRLQENDFERMFAIGSDFPEESQGYITVTIKDNGFGIVPEVYDKLFSRGATRKPDKKDHGIGLWAAKRFVERHGGTMTCETKLGKGTKFEFTIPYASRIGTVYRQ